MNCDDVYPLIHAYADGELELGRSLDVERHLETCANCAEARRSIQSLRTALRESKLVFAAPSALRKRIRRALPRRHGGAPARAIRWFWPGLAFAATAVALAMILLRPGAISERERLADAAIGSHVRSLMANHLTDVASSDQHTVKPWFNGRIDFAPEVKDFAAQGFPLRGGRLDYLDGRSVAALVYQHNQHLINVFVWPAENRPETETENRRGYSIIHREVNGLHYLLISDLNAKELGAFAALLK